MIANENLIALPIVIGLTKFAIMMDFGIFRNYTNSIFS